jgi:dUTP pyrophosphatase
MNKLEEQDLLQRVWDLEQILKQPINITEVTWEPIALEVKMSYDQIHNPSRANPTDAGIDLATNGKQTLIKGVRTLVRTGVSVKIPEGYVGLLVPRSSLSKWDVVMTNSIGIIDSDYRGELMASLMYKGMQQSFDLEDGLRIVQLVIVPILLSQLVEFEGSDEDWVDTKRGIGGFGSTG